MFRGRSNSNENGSQLGGDGDGRPKGRQGKPTKQARRKVDPKRSEQRGFDPRSLETGKKIRRIEAGPGLGRGADPTELGGPPAQPVPGGLANRTPSLPPLKQPTGNVPRVPADANATGGEDRSNGSADLDSDQTVSLPNGSAGVFGQNRPPSADREIPPGRPLRAVAGVDEASGSEGAIPGLDDPKIEDELDAVQNELRGAAADPSAQIDEQMPDIPSALPEFDDLATGAESSDGFASVGAAVAGVGVGANMSGRDPFNTSDPRPSAAVAAASRGSQAPLMDGTRQMPRDLGGPGDFDGGRHDGGRTRGTPRRERPQDTEFKLADNRPRRKPKEPNRLLLVLALGLVLLAGAAAAWYLTQGDDSGEVAGDTEDVATTDTTVADTTADTVAPEAPVTQEPAVSEPTLFFDAATSGPLQQGETYSIDLVGEPEGSMLQVVVDDIPQGNPDPLLPDLILPPGRHTLYIQITNGAEITQSTPVDLYVLGDPPPQGFRANLSSVDMQTEGWQEAIRQFDEFKANGHEALQLMPLSPGFWNLFIGGLGEDRAAAQGYCESFGLAVPDQCFPTYFEAAAGATDSATTETTVAESTTESTDAMTDEDTTSTTVAGG